MGSQFILQHNYSQIQLIGKYNRLYCKALIVNCPIGGLSCIASPCLWLWLPLEGKPWTRATIVKKRIDLSQKMFFLLTKKCLIIITVKSSEHAEVLLKAVPAITRSWWMRRWWRGGRAAVPPPPESSFPQVVHPSPCPPIGQLWSAGQFPGLWLVETAVGDLAWRSLPAELPVLRTVLEVGTDQCYT